jgi:hypothetical protein
MNRPTRLPPHSCRSAYNLKSTFSASPGLTDEVKLSLGGCSRNFAVAQRGQTASRRLAFIGR